MDRTKNGAQFKGRDISLANDTFNFQNESIVTEIPVSNTKNVSIGEPSSFIPLVTPNGIKYIPVYSEKYGTSGSRGPYSNIDSQSGRVCNLCHSNCNKNYSNYDDCTSLCDTTCNKCNTCQGCQRCDDCLTGCHRGCQSCQGCDSCNGCQGCNSCYSSCRGCYGCDSCDTCQSCNSCEGCHGCHGSGNCYSGNCGSNHSCTGTDK